MTQVTSRYHTLIIISAAIGWLFLLGSVGWWQWQKYQNISKVDTSQIKAAGVELKVEQLEQAVKLLGG